MRREHFHAKVSIAILVGIFSIMFFSIRLTNALIILYVLNWLASNPLKAWSWQKMDWLMLLVISPWVLELVSVLYSANIITGIHQVEKRLTLLAIPIITIHSTDNAVKDRVKVFRIVTICTAVVTLYCLLLSLYNVLFQSAKMAYWENFTQPIIFAPVYLSLIINIVSIWIIFRLVGEWSTLTLSRKILYLCLIGYFGTITFLLASKLHAVIFVAIVIIGMVLIYRKHVVSWKASLFIVVLLFVIGFSVSNSEIKERFAHIHNFTMPNFDAPDADFNELTLRLAIFKCATSIVKENLIFGTGVGDVMTDLESVYRSVNFKFGYNNSYDPHNQYLRICLGTGLVGLALFLTGLIVVLKRALHNGDWLVFGVMILYSISFLFESILERHNGIVIFAFIHSTLIFGINNSIKANLGSEIDN